MRYLRKRLLLSGIQTVNTHTHRLSMRAYLCVRACDRCEIGALLVQMSGAYLVVVGWSGCHKCWVTVDVMHGPHLEQCREAQVE